MEKFSIVCLVLFFLTLSVSLSQGGHHSASKPRSQITVIGTVYCDICSNNTFSRHSYFLPEFGVWDSTRWLPRQVQTVLVLCVGQTFTRVEVKVDCKFKARAARSAEEITFSVNRTTNEYGWYKMEIPSVDGIECARGATVESVCRASLVGSSTSKCNVPGYTTTTDVVYFKSRQQNICIYGLSALNFRPSRKNKDLCAN